MLLSVWGELSSNWGELSLACGTSCPGASFMWGELSWGELSWGEVSYTPPESLGDAKHIRMSQTGSEFTNV